MQIQRIQVRNRGESEIVMHIEDWGEQYPVPPNVTYDVTFRGPEGEWVLVEYASSKITLFGWGGSTVEVKLDGKLLD